MRVELKVLHVTEGVNKRELVFRVLIRSEVVLKENVKGKKKKGKKEKKKKRKEKRKKNLHFSSSDGRVGVAPPGAPAAEDLGLNSLPEIRALLD